MLAGAIGVTQIIGVLAGPVFALMAMVDRDRSLLIWVAMVPGVLVLSGIVQIFMSMNIGEELYGPYGLPIYGLPIGVLIWAVLVISLMWGTRNSGES